MSNLPNFAGVRFFGEKCDAYIVPVCDIKLKRTIKKSKHKNIAILHDFTPHNFEDFEKNQWYRVKWPCTEHCKQQHNHNGFYHAIILHLGNTESEVQQKIDQSRSIFPNQIQSEDSITTQSSFSTDEEETTQVNIEKRASQNIGKQIIQTNKRITQSTLSTDEKETTPVNVEKRDLQNIGRQLVKANKIVETKTKRSTKLDEEDDTDVDENDFQTNGVSKIRIISNEVVKIPVKGIPGRENLNNNMEPQNDASVTEANELATVLSPSRASENFTNNVQNKNFDVYEESDLMKRPKKKKFRRPPAKVNLNIENLKRYEVVNDQVYLGLNVYVDEDVWLKMEAQGKPTLFLRDLADIIWTPYELVIRAFQVNKTKAITPGRVAAERRHFEEDKWQLLTDMNMWFVDVYKDYLAKNISDINKIKYYLNSMRKTIKQKIQDLRASFRRQRSYQEC